MNETLVVVVIGFLSVVVLLQQWALWKVRDRIAETPKATVRKEVDGEWYIVVSDRADAQDLTLLLEFLEHLKRIGL